MGIKKTVVGLLNFVTESFTRITSGHKFKTCIPGIVKSETITFIVTKQWTPELKHLYKKCTRFESYFRYLGHIQAKTDEGLSCSMRSVVANASWGRGTVVRLIWEKLARITMRSSGYFSYSQNWLLGRTIPVGGGSSIGTGRPSSGVGWGDLTFRYDRHKLGSSEAFHCHINYFLNTQASQLLISLVMVYAVFQYHPFSKKVSRL